MNSFACGICCEGFDDEKRCPRLLSCGHSFCESCLKKLVQAAVVTCPNCRKEAPVPGGVSGLPKNFALLDALLAAPKEDLATRVCNICSDEHNAQFACLDCKQNFCQQASLWHTKTKLTLNHRVVSFEELKANPQLLQTSNICPEHDGEAFRFFDQDCGRVICRDCVALDHRTHNCSSLAQAAATYRGEIGGKVEQVVARAKQMEAAETRAAEVSQSLDENFEREASKIRAAFQKIHDAATAREALLVQELTQHHKAKSATLSNQRDLLHTSRACLESVVQRTQNAIKSQDDVQLLVTRSDLISTLAALAAQPLAPEADDALTFFVAPDDILETLKKVGAVSDKVTCAAQTTAEAACDEKKGIAPLVVRFRKGHGVRVSENGLLVSNRTRRPHSVFGPPIKTGRWVFHIDVLLAPSYIMFGLASTMLKPSSATYNSQGSFLVSAEHTYANGIEGPSNMVFHAGDNVQMELKDGSGSKEKALVVTNLRTQLAASLKVPAGAYKLHIRLPASARVTWAVAGG